jgi:hypothetical protein
MIRPILAEAFGCFPESVERAFQVDGDLPIEGRVISAADTRQQHNAGIVDQDVDSSEFLFSDFEHPRNLVRLADVGFCGDRVSPADVILLTSAEASGSLPA